MLRLELERQLEQTLSQIIFSERHAENLRFGKAEDTELSVFRAFGIFVGFRKSVRTFRPKFNQFILAILESSNDVCDYRF
jgi:hypothetical protein